MKLFLLFRVILVKLFSSALPYGYDSEMSSLKKRVLVFITKSKAIFVSEMGAKRFLETKNLYSHYPKIEICKYCYFVGSGDKLGEVSAKI